jgi:hypothetical protein
VAAVKKDGACWMDWTAKREEVMTEADTCREFVTPRLVEAGWSVSPCSIGEQGAFTNDASSELIAGMRSHELEVMRLLGEIEAPVGEVEP